MSGRWWWFGVAVGIGLGAPPAAAQDLPIGRVERAVSADSQAANRAALAHHQAGRHAQSEAGWAALLASEPDHDMARFNHACALARLGRLDEARAELVVVLHHDLPTFEQRLADPDLAPLHADPALASLRAALRARYAAAAAAGHPSVVVGARTRACGAAFDRIDASVQAGVLDRGTQRFVPLAPRVHAEGSRATPHAHAAAYFDPAAQRTLVVTALSANADVPRLERGTLDVWGSDLTHVSHTSLAPAAARFDVAFAPRSPAPGAATFDTAVCQVDRDGDASDGVVQAAGSVGPPAIRCDGAGLSPLLVRDEGWTIVTNLPAGASLRGNLLRLANGTSVSLPGHGLPEHSVLVSGDHAVVLSMRWLLGESDLEHRHVVDRVHLPTQRIERLSQGASPASIRSGTDGALYVEANGELRRYASLDASSFEVLPRWVHLTLPGPVDCSP